MGEQLPHSLSNPSLDAIANYCFFAHFLADGDADAGRNTLELVTIVGL